MGLSMKCWVRTGIKSAPHVTPFGLYHIGSVACWNCLSIILLPSPLGEGVEGVRLLERGMGRGYFSYDISDQLIFVFLSSRR